MESDQSYLLEKNRRNKRLGIKTEDESGNQTFWGLMRLPRNIPEQSTYGLPFKKCLLLGWFDMEDAIREEARR